MLDSELVEAIRGQIEQQLQVMEQTTAQLDEPNLTTHKIDEFSEDARQQKQLEDIVHK